MINSTQAVPAINPSEIRIVDGRATTTSLHVAEHFGKLHKNVLKAIAALDCSPEFHKLNFEPMEIEVPIGMGKTRKDPAFRMTRDGFTFLCMGFTGKEAAKWKEAYINAFNQMEAELQQQASANAMLAPADEDTILLHYNRRPLFVYRHGQDFWYRAAHVSALVGARDSHALTRALPPAEVNHMQAGNQKASMISHRGMLASLGRLKSAEAEALLNWLQLTIPGAFTPITAQPAQSEVLNPADPSSLLRAVLAGNRFLCTLDDMGRITLREIPNDHLIIAAERIPTWIADPQGPKPAALANILQAVSHRMGRAA
jgi:Rha family phage regulatory protein